MRVLPRTHMLGVLSDDGIHDLGVRITPVDCVAAKGGVVAMQAAARSCVIANRGLKCRDGCFISSTPLRLHCSSAAIGDRLENVTSSSSTRHLEALSRTARSLAYRPASPGPRPHILDRRADGLPSADGTLILRNEDLDSQRCREEFVQAMIEDLRWLGISWQEGPDCGGPIRSVRAERAAEFLSGRLEAACEIWARSIRALARGRMWLWRPRPPMTETTSRFIPGSVDRSIPGLPLRFATEVQHETAVSTWP